MEGTVLFVDDDPRLLKGIRRALSDQPFRVLLAGHADEALAILERHEIHVLVTDQEMPGLKGTMLLDVARKRHPGVVRILLTGRADLEISLQAINRGEVFRLCTKPIEAEQLASVIRAALEHREFLCTSRDLLHTVKRQTGLMARLEREHPGITEVETDDEGRIVLDEDSFTDLSAFLADARKELGK